MVWAGTQWNIPVLSNIISVFSNATFLTRDNSLVVSFLLWWLGVWAIWNSFRFRLSVASTATSTTENYIGQYSLLELPIWKVFKNGWKKELTVLAHAPPYQVFICDVSMASIAEEVGPEYVSTKLKLLHSMHFHRSSLLTHLLTSSADWAQKYPMVFPGVFACRGFIEISVSSFASSSFTSIATNNSLSFTKQILKKRFSFLNF